MKIDNINPKAVEFFKKHGKKIGCLAAATVALAIPSKAKLEEHDEAMKTSLMNQPKVSDTIETKEVDNSFVMEVKTNNWEKKYNINMDSINQELFESIANEICEETYKDATEEDRVFTFYAPWEKSKNYSDTKENDFREYEREVFTMRPNENFNIENYKINDYFARNRANLYSDVPYAEDVNYGEMLNTVVNGEIGDLFDIVGRTKETTVVTKDEESDLDQWHYKMRVNGTEIVVKMYTKEANRQRMIATLIFFGPVILIIGGSIIYHAVKYGM